MKPEGSHFSPTWNSALKTILVYGGMALLFTLLGILLGPPGALIGGTRPVNTIPTHLGELAGFGLLLGLGIFAIFGKKGLPLVFLTPALTVLLDIDHLPIYLGIAEPVRPAHSLVFIIAALAASAIIVKALNVELVVASAFMGHLAVDTGIFPPFSPLNLEYIPLDTYRLPLAAGAILTAFIAGVILRRQSRRADHG